MSVLIRCGVSIPLSSSDYSATYNAAKAFDGNDGTYWRGASSAGPEWIGAELFFAKAVTKARIHTGTGYRPRAYAIEGSDDGTTWVEIATGELASSTGWQDVIFSNTVAYKYWRAYFTTRWTTYYAVRDIEFYSEYDNDFSYTSGIKITFSHPIVTEPVDDPVSMTNYLPRLPETPLSSSDYSATYDAAKAFDGLENTYWRGASSAGPEWLGGDFGYSLNISRVRMHVGNSYRPKDFIIEGSSDGISWVAVDSGQIAEEIGWQEFEVAGLTTYRYWRAYFSNCWTSYYALRDVEFYETEVLYHTNGFTVSSDTYDKSPEGELVSKQYTIKRVTKSEDSLSLFIWLYIPDRLRYLASQLTVAYDKAIGSFMGAYSMQVDSFSLSFAPVNVRTEPTPNEPIHLDADITAISEAILIYYRDRATDEAIEGTITVVSQAIHIDDIID